MGATTPQATIRQYAGLWCNWTTGNVLSHETQMAALSVSRARTQALLIAATQRPPSSSVTNTCTIESIAEGRSVAAGRWVLVTAAQTAAAATPSAAPLYHVTYITLARRGGRYLVSSWAPRS